MTDITELALIKGQKVEAPYYLAECTECGKMYSSSKLIVSRNYFDGDADCYCPHCNADDADIADLGSGEQPAVMAWNYQQARIDTLVEALEKAQATEAHCNRGWIEAHEQEARAEAAEQRIAELESRTVTLPKPKDSDPGWKIDPEFISKVQNAIGYDDQCECWEGTPSMEVVEAVLLAAAGTKMEVE